MNLVDRFSKLEAIILRGILSCGMSIHDGWVVYNIAGIYCDQYCHLYVVSELELRLSNT